MPEFMVALSCDEYYNALEDYTITHNLCPEWTLQHSFFANMGGFTLEDGDSNESGKELYEKGAMLTKSACEKYSYEIRDKAKTNILTKAIAIIQISRFLLEEIDRALNGLPISPLEYFTCAQVFAALLMYIYWLEKPYGIQEKIKVEKGLKRRIRVQHENRKVQSMFITFTIVILTILIRQVDGSQEYVAGGYTTLLIAASALSSWNVPFSSSGMRVLWKVVSVGSAVCPAVVIFTTWQEDTRYDLDHFYEFGWSDKEGIDKLLSIIFWVSFPLHIVFRVILIVLIFLSFRNLPHEIYETRSWLAFLPSFH